MGEEEPATAERTEGGQQQARPPRSLTEQPDPVAQGTGTVQKDSGSKAGKSMARKASRGKRTHRTKAPAGRKTSHQGRRAKRNCQGPPDWNQGRTETEPHTSASPPSQEPREEPPTAGERSRVHATSTMTSPGAGKETRHPSSTGEDVGASTLRREGGGEVAARPRDRQSQAPTATHVRNIPAELKPDHPHRGRKQKRTPRR